ncbi:hypothetical protein NIES970_16560 [[Synechococcus] sp. NIES-970]|nr:hypothetical protein NIES970_16560 [[Synechococcus] sp. NIES-970]
MQNKCEIGVSFMELETIKSHVIDRLEMKLL